MTCSIDATANCADGITADIQGHRYDVFRLTKDSQVDWLTEANKIGSMNVYYELSKNEKPGLETERRTGIIWYRVTGNFSSVLLNDVFVLSDACVPLGKLVAKEGSDYQGFCFVQARSGPKKPYGARINTTVQLFRPRDQASKDGYHEPTGIGVADGLILSDGKFVLDSEGAEACNIPAGLSAMRPYGDRAISDVGSMSRKSLFGCYLPLLSGFVINEGDRVVAKDGSRYVVLVAYSQGAGATGYQLTLEREVGTDG